MATFISRVTNLNWTSTIISPVAIMFMEVLWVYPWLVWTREYPALGWQRSPLNLISLIFLIGIAFYINKYFPSRSRRSLFIQLGILLFAIFLVIGIEYRDGFIMFSGQWFGHITRTFLGSFSQLHPITLALIVSVYICWRGIRLGHSNLFFMDVYPSFLFGLAALVLLIFLWTISMGTGSLESLASTIGFHVAGFFFFGLSVLALGNLQLVRRRMQKEEISPVSTRRWITILFGVIGGIVLVGMGIASIFSTDFVSFLASFFGSVLDILYKVMYYVLIPFDYLARGIGYAIEFIVNLIRGGKPLEPFTVPPFLAPGEIPEGPAYQPVGVDVLLILKWVFFAVFTIAVLFLLARAISRFRALRADTEIEEINESLWSWQGFKADLRLFLSMILRRWRRKRMEPVPVSTVPDWYKEEEIKGTLKIRDIYRHLLWEASNSGVKLKLHETPYEYERRLGQVLTGSSEQLSELTNMYVNVRYGDIEVQQEKLEQANSIWRLLRRVLRGQIRAPR